MELTTGRVGRSVGPGMTLAIWLYIHYASINSSFRSRCSSSSMFHLSNIKWNRSTTPAEFCTQLSPQERPASSLYIILEPLVPVPLAIQWKHLDD